MAHQPDVEPQDQTSSQESGDEYLPAIHLPCRGTAEIRILTLNVKLSATLLDLSVGGCHIETASPMPSIEHPVVELHLSLNGFNQRLAGVVRTVEADHILGIDFIDVTSRKAQQLQELVDDLALMQKDRVGEG